MVCWVLNYLFTTFPYKDKIAFKGGTSLSKSFKIVNRFSEDIDLILMWEFPDIPVDEPYKKRSNTKQSKYNDEVNRRTVKEIKEIILPILVNDFEKNLKEDFSVYIDLEDQQTICFNYPKSYSDASILQVIRLEIGALAEPIPVEHTFVTSYIQEEYPQIFTKENIPIVTVSTLRTFFEKLTILHREAFRTNGSYPKRYSRHYYDVYQIISRGKISNYETNLDLLFQVVEFKKKFYSCNWAKYDNIYNGDLKLVPSSEGLKEFKEDYENMKNMLFGEYPNFDQIIELLAEFENSINIKIKNYT